MAWELQTGEVAGSLTTASVTAAGTVDVANTSRTVILHDNGESTDYTGAKRHDITMTEAPTEGVTEYEFVATTTAHTVVLSHLTTCHRVLVENKGATEIIVTWRQVITDATAYADVTFAAGPPGTATRVGDTSFLNLPVAAGAYVTFADAVDSGNNDTFFVQQVTSTVMTFNEDATIAAQANDAVTIAVIRDFVTALPAGEAIILTNPQPSNDMTIGTLSGTSAVSYSFTGV